MKEINIGDLHASFDGQALTLGRNNPKSLYATLDAEGIEALHRFLTAAMAGRSNQRQSFRLGQPALKDLKVRLGIDDLWRTVLARDLSVTGLSVLWMDDEALELPHMSEIDVSLTLEGNTIMQPALVRRCDAKGLGLFFPEAMRGEHIDPPAELVALVLDLQRRNLAHQFGAGAR